MKAPAQLLVAVVVAGCAGRTMPVDDRCSNPPSRVASAVTEWIDSNEIVVVGRVSIADDWSAEITVHRNIKGAAGSALNVAFPDCGAGSLRLSDGAAGIVVASLEGSRFIVRTPDGPAEPLDCSRVLGLLDLRYAEAGHPDQRVEWARQTESDCRIERVHLDAAANAIDVWATERVTDSLDLASLFL